MLDPSIAELKLRYRERLEEAENCQPFNQGGTASPGLLDRIMLNLRNYLMSLGQELKARFQPCPAVPCPDDVV
jgi:hypothetical protein